MAEIDPMILELRAEVQKYQADVARATKFVDNSLAQQERAARRLEHQMRKSSDEIGGTVKSLATTLAAAFTGRELVGMLDSFTRFENALKVAGLEGANLAAVQEQLFTTAQRNGVALEAVGTLYGRAAQSSKELGASTADLLNFTNAVAASLKLTGTTTEEASGALLQLGQALGSPRVQAEEFNSLIDTMRPLLVEAAKNIDGTGGSLAGLIAKLKDTKGPGLSNIELFRGITAAMEELQRKAADASLTLTAGFTTLSNALTKYFGEADKANGVSAALGQAMQQLADNLDLIIPALAAIGTALGVGFVTNAVRAAAAATGIGTALLGALGGPVGIAISAIVLALGYLAAESANSSAAAKELANQSTRTKAAMEAEKRATDALAAAKGKDAAAGMAAVQASRARAAQALQTAKSLKAEAEAELALARARGAKLSEATDKFQAALPAGVGRVAVGGTRENYNERQQLQRKIDRQNSRIAKAEGEIQGIDAAIAAAQAPVKLAPVTIGGGAKSGGASTGAAGPTGPSAAEIANRFYDELASYRSQAVAAEAQIARNANERAELELIQVETARNAALRGIRNDADYSEAQKEALKLALEGVVDREIAAVEFRRRAENERVAQDLADERFQSEQDSLRLQLDLADMQAERRDIALRILAAEDEYLQSKLEAVIASQTATDAEKERARIALEAVNATSGARQDGVEKQYQSALGRYADNAKDADSRVAEAAAQRIADLNDTIANAMTDALGIKDPFLSELIKIFLDKNVFGPLAEALDSKGGGGLGGFFSAIGSIFKGGRASGGRVDAGSLYRVNEGASPGRVEGFIPDVGGQIIPLGRMNAARPAAAGGGTSVVRLELSGDIDARIQSVSGPVAVEVVKLSQPSLTQAAVAETFKQAGRPRM